MCECYKIGGPWIVEDPNCPIHGTEARSRQREISKLRVKLENTQDINELKSIMGDILNLID